MIMPSPQTPIRENQISRFQSLGIVLWPNEDGSLGFDAPADVADEVLEELRQHKDELLAALHAEDAILARLANGAAHHRELLAAAHGAGASDLVARETVRRLQEAGAIHHTLSNAGYRLGPYPEAGE